eukprot:8822115-Ditylum_brightwellii.AAC.1
MDLHYYTSALCTMMCKVPNSRYNMVRMYWRGMKMAVLREEMEHRQLQLQDELKVANKVEDKEEDYVYDVYCLEENEDDNDENDSQNKQKGTTPIKEEKKDEVLSPKKVATGPTSDTTATESTSITTPD